MTRTMRSPALALAFLVVMMEGPSVWAASDDSIEKGQQSKVVESASRLSDTPIPLQLEAVPDRPKLLLEWGDTFLGTGALGSDITLPTGAVWRPSLWVFGTYRTAVQTFDTGATRFSEWAHRLDLFANLKLSASERILIGFRPLDQDGRFTRLAFEPQGNFQDELNASVTTLFFDGDVGEIFPNLDVADRNALDLGFSIGLQPLFFQEGMLINDNIEAIGLTRNNWLIPGTSNVRVTALYGWNNVNRDDNQDDQNARLFGLFTETDLDVSTVDLDLVYVNADEDTGDALFAGISGVQRVGHVNTAFRVNSSFPLDRETLQTSRGTLFFSEISWTPPSTHDIVYLNTFWGIDRFSSAARGFATGGPLGRTGILFAAVGLGRFGAALGNQADDSVGGSLGYQRFFDQTRKQLIVEVGGRKNTKNTDRIGNQGALAAGLRYQQAFGQHFIGRFDTFTAIQEQREQSYGVRLEWVTKF